MAHKSFADILSEVSPDSGHSSSSQFTPGELEFDYVDHLDAQILMHRDAHFGGKFDIMLEHYHIGRTGTQADLPISRIEYLARCEAQIGDNLAASLLSGPQAEEVARARATYRQLRAVCESDLDASSPVRLIADLALSEEEEPSEEIKALVNAGESALPDLIRLLQADQFLSPLYPGFGEAPLFAARCLGLIGSEAAVVPLFEALGTDNIDLEEEVTRALRLIRAPAKNFLLKALKTLPITHDNERAAICLGSFGADPDIAECCLELLECMPFFCHETLRPYLVLGCEALDKKMDQERFKILINKDNFPEDLRADTQLILGSWQAKPVLHQNT